jgi:hypothetical protein
MESFLRINKLINQGNQMINMLDLHFNIEVWKAIDGYPNYHVSNMGNVKNIKGNILKPIIDVYGYEIVCLYAGKTKKQCKIHRLVAIAFISNPYNKLCVDHKNNNKKHNKVSNLRWVTNQQNDFNRQLSSNNKSGCKGVYFSKKDKIWCAQIMINGKSIHLGSYKTLEEAKVARQIKATELFGEYTNSCEKE